MPDVVTPDWVKDAIFYQIFPDRFARSEGVAKPSGLQPWGAPPTPHGYQGGDLRGVIEHLDTLVDLGINAIYFTPVFRSASNHRYHTHDYYQVDPLLGGNEALADLLDAAHGRGIRVVLDGVFNHASRGFFQFNDILENGPESAYLDWFTVDRLAAAALRQQTAELSLLVGRSGAAEIQHQYAGRARVPVGRRPPLDRVRHRRLAAGCARRDRRRCVLARVSPPREGRQPRSVHRGRDLGRRRPVAAGGSVRRRDELWRLTRRPRLLCGADVRPGIPARRVSPARDGRAPIRARDRAADEALPLAHRPDAAQSARQPRYGPFHHPGGRRPQRAGAGAALPDDDSRRAVHLLRHRDRHGGRPRPRLPPRVPWDEAAWDHDLRDTTRRAIALRKARPALRRGAFERFYASNEVCTFGRRTADDAVVVAFNAGHEERTFNVDVGDLLPDGTAIDLWGGGSGSGGGAGAEARVLHGTLRNVTLPPRSAAVFGMR